LLHQAVIRCGLTGRLRALWSPFFIDGATFSAGALSPAGRAFRGIFAHSLRRYGADAKQQRGGYGRQHPAFFTDASSDALELLTVSTS
jgi:hypothetical protein